MDENAIIARLIGVEDKQRTTHALARILDDEVNGLDRKVDALDEKVEGIDRKVDNIDRNVQELAGQVGSTNTQLKSLTQMMGKVLKHLNIEDDE